ncbi:MAG: hypothetical protein P1V81_13530, partial [Planctomycetota bacterium]|nr:hypothetical protein [Planctomycetota bacterium]
MVRPLTLFVPLATFLLSAAAAAGTITVGPTGSGAQFDDIADAITAAQPGDVLLVASGQYVDATPLVVDKPLTILGAGSDTTSFQAVATSPFDKPLPLHVVGLQAGEEVRIAGLTLRSQTLGGFVASTFVVENCVGPVVLSDIS